jgi:hypothetical protein
MLIGSSSFVTLNPQGYEKVIRSFFGKYYTQTLEEVAAQSGITSQQVIDRMLTDLRVLKNVYKITMAKYQNAVANREVLVREGQVPPPKFLDDSLKLAPGVGSISYTKVQRTKELRNQLAVMKEVTDHLYGNNETIPPILPTDDIDEIARRLNAKPSRVEFNESRKRANIQRAREGKDALPLALFTPDAIQMYIDMIDVQREKIGEGANKQQVVESINNIEKNYFSIDPATGETRIDPSTGKEAETYGFEDLKTAIYVLKLHMSSVARDKETKAHTAVPNATAFDVPIDMQNVTSKDLAASRTAPKLTKEQREVNQEVLEEEIGKMPEAGKQLVTPKGEEVPLAEGEDPLAGIDVEKTPKQIPQPFPPEEISEEQKMVNLEDIIGSTVKNLIKIASELDENGKEEAAEEIHKIIRKYQARVF